MFQSSLVTFTAGVYTPKERMPHAQSMLRAGTATGFVRAAIFPLPFYSRLKACRGLQAAHDRFEALAASPAVRSASDVLSDRGSVADIGLPRSDYDWQNLGRVGAPLAILTRRILPWA